MKKFLFIYYFLIAVSVAMGQSLTVNAPQEVSVGQKFRLTYTINTHDVSEFQIGQIPSDGFEVLMGPSVSKSSSYSINNGHATHNSSIVYTYILYALKDGIYTIPAASVKSEGKLISSNSLRIHVTGSNNGLQSQHQNKGLSSQENIQKSDARISSSDLFILVSASKKSVFEQEPVLLTYKVYTSVGLTQLDGKMPELKGFHTLEIPLPQQKSFKVEQYNGRNYKTVTWSQYVMFPQLSGKLQVPPIIFNGIVVQQNRYVDPFEAFFNGGSGYTEVKKQIKAPGIDINVIPLPDRPSNFSGGVGDFSMSVEVEKKEFKTNDPVTVKVTISGIGNLRLIKEPTVNFPKDFDTYNVKITDKTRLTTNGLEGSIIYEYLAVPRHHGHFTIEPVEFIYFDSQEKKYKTLHSDSYNLIVSKVDGEDSQVHSYTDKEDIKMLGSDIRHIKTDKVLQYNGDDHFFMSSLYIISLSCLALIFILLFIIFRTRAINNADIVKTRGKNANKVAEKRLKKAVKLMKEKDENNFYDEVLKALWGYVGDKLNIPVEQLSRDNICEKLLLKNCDETTITFFVEAIDDCEFERYSPSNQKGDMEKVYNKAIIAIENIEKRINHPSNKSSSIKSILLILLFLPSFSNAMTKEDADSSYINGNYATAIQQYKVLLKEGNSYVLNYNLGNSYYRIDSIAKAILYYERALILSPSDDDIRYNLQLARSKTVDKITPKSELFIISWYYSLINYMSIDGWAYLSLFLFLMVIFLALIYLFASSLLLRKIGFFGSLFIVVLFFLTIFFAWNHKYIIDNHDYAIIMKSAITVKSTPSLSGTDLFLLHEGTKINIIDNSIIGWYEVCLPDGKQGWVESNQIEII